MKKKIGIDARALGWTGIGRYLRNLLREIFVLDEINNYVIYLKKEDQHLLPPLSPRVSLKFVDIPHYSLAEQWKLFRELHREKFDLVHFPHFNVPIMYRLPYVVTIHDITLHFFPGQKMTGIIDRLGYNATMRAACKHAAQIIAVSKNTKKDIENIIGIDPEKIHVIYESVEFDRYHTKIDKHKIDTLKKDLGIQRPYLLYTGVWRNHKNILGLLKAFRKVRDAGIDYDLVITGRPDPHYPEVPEEIAKLNIADSVRLPGLVPEEDLPVLYAGASLFVYPSFYEGFGLPPLEAMACGTPVVSSNTSAMPEILGDAVEYFDPYDTDMMARTIVRVLRSEALQVELRRRGLDRVHQYNWRSMAVETLGVYQTQMKKYAGKAEKEI